MTHSMEECIRAELRQVEQAHGVRIIYAVESGSRAWGFASPDSDYDVRFIYVCPMEDYLRLGKRQDFIDWKLDEVLDISGWDLIKAMRLLHASNPTFLEWCNSPIKYVDTEEFQSLKQAADDNFLLNAGLHHYLHIASGTYKSSLAGKEKVSLKKYMYVLRPLLAARWILEKHTPPPVLFSDLVEAELDEGWQAKVEALVKRKMTLKERDLVPPDAEMNGYLETEIRNLLEMSKGLPKEQKRHWQPLDELFLRLIGAR